MSRFGNLRKAWTSARVDKKLRKMAEKKRAEQEPMHFVASARSPIRAMKPILGRKI